MYCATSVNLQFNQKISIVIKIIIKIFGSKFDGIFSAIQWYCIQDATKIADKLIEKVFLDKQID